MRMPDPNAPECDCGTLERLASDPLVGVIFDLELNEYHFQRGDDPGPLIYHCPFCGGRAPKSRRNQLFAHAPVQELLRLSGLTKDYKTVAEVFAAFGSPQSDHPAGYGITTPATDLAPSKTDFYRMLIFEHLSPVADVHVTVYPDESVHFSFVEKYIGRPHEG